jgi:hypothetical protein
MYMRKFLTLLIITITIAGCKKSDPPSPIIGTWATGQDVAIYYIAGKEVYRQTTPAPTTISATYQFASDGTLTLNSITGGVSTVYNTLNYSLSNSNTTLTLSSGGSSSTHTVSFTDSNTLIITTNYTTGVGYYVNGNYIAVDSETDQSTLSRISN